MIQNYQIFVVDCNTGQTTFFSDGTNLYELRYTRLLNDVGVVAFVVALEGSPNLTFADDNFVIVQRSNPVSGQMQIEEVFFIRSRELFSVGDDQRVTVGGVSLNNLLQRRVIDPVDDPLAAGGYVTRAGAADTVMADFARYQGGQDSSVARRFPSYTVLTPSGAGQQVGTRTRYEQLFDILVELGIKGLMDFEVSLISGTTSTQLSVRQIGVDRTQTTNEGVFPFVRLDPLRGNLQNVKLRIDRRDEGNFVYVQGQGQGADRVLYTQAGDGVNDTPYNRIEFTADQRQIEKGESLVTPAGAKLRDRQREIEFTYEPVIGAAGAVYRLDFDLGDYITVAWLDYQEDVRIIGVEIQLSMTGASNESITLITQSRINQ